MDILAVPTLLLLKAIIGLLVILVVADIIISWLVAANIVNVNNQFVYMIVISLSNISEFMLRPIRKRLPMNIGAFDITPVLLILLLKFIENIIDRVLIRFV